MLITLARNKFNHTAETRDSIAMQRKMLLIIHLFALLTFSYFDTAFARKRMKFLNTEEKLFFNLTSTNVKHLRPVESHNETVNVTMDITLRSLSEVDVKKGIAIVESVLHLRWRAPNLVWDPQDYDGIKKLTAPIDKIWQPEIFNFKRGVDGLKLVSTTAVIYNDGSMYWLPPASIATSCDFNMRAFPYDSHVCAAELGSLVYRGNELSFDISSDRVLNHHYQPHQEWDLYNTSIIRHVTNYGYREYHSVMVFFTWKRRSTVLSYIYISPIVLLALMSPFIFLLPYQQSERFSLGGSILICLIVLLAGLDMVFPMTISGLPLISMYYMSVVVVLLLAMIVSAVILNLAEKVTEPPQLLKKVLGVGLGCVLFVKSEDYANLVEKDEGEGMKKADVITWRYIAAVLDRFFFVLYIILTIVLAAALATPK